MSDRIVEFVRKKDLIFVKELGQGACGRTVLLHDDVIDENFVCKKFVPLHEALKHELFKNFVREIKLLHKLNHPNVVRVFNYYLYPDRLVGYILMELVQGLDIEEYLIVNPSEANQIFLQIIDGFAHLERHEILHRDIRPTNILVSRAGVPKIIDFGFGKQVKGDGDFDKSITLNWWCEPPSEFGDQVYDYSTEVYFVGKLFEKILLEAGAEQFAHKGLLSRMCARNRNERIGSFARIRQELLAGKIDDIPFSEEELCAYRTFAGDLSSAVSKIEQSAKYFDDVAEVERKLEVAYRSVMLEEQVPNNSPVLACFINGSYYYSRKSFVRVDSLRDFVQLLRSCSKEKKGVILSNLFTRLNAVTRYRESEFDDDIPF